MPGDFPLTIPPMLARAEKELPRGDGWSYEPKWDGFRTIVFRGDDGVRLQSRDEKPLDRYFPEVAAVVAATSPARWVGDGEILIVRPEGLGFDELLQRIHPAASRVAKLAAEWPATLILFDLLAEGDDDLRDRPLAERRDRLTALTGRLGIEQAPQDLEHLMPGPQVLVTPWTHDVDLAERWFADEAGIGQDGVVAKPDDVAYRAGERVMVKVKHRRTVDCVVGGYRVAKNGDGVGSLLLGLYGDDDVLHYVGHTSSFKIAERRQIREILAPLEGGESFGEGRTPGGPSRWSAGRDTAWVSLEPSVVCEVSVDRLQSGRFRHAATFIRWREDRDPRSCTFDQLGGSPPGWVMPSHGS
jgi:ATP-dependent DNA ligase